MGCEHCQGSTLPGVLLPTDFDDREPSRDGKVFVAACTTCDRYASDRDAAHAVRDATGWPIELSLDETDAIDRDERARRKGSAYGRPYFAVTLAQAIVVMGGDLARTCIPLRPMAYCVHAFRVTVHGETLRVAFRTVLGLHPLARDWAIRYAYVLAIVPPEEDVFVAVRKLRGQVRTGELGMALSEQVVPQAGPRWPI